MTRLKYTGRLFGLALIASLITIVRFSPRFSLWRGLDIPPAENLPELQRAVFILQQQAQPFAATAGMDANRGAAWRLLFPLLGHYLYLPRLAILFTPHLGCVLVLAYIIHLVMKHRGTRLDAILAAILLSSTSWFFVSTGWLGYEDSWCVLSLLAISFANHRIVLAAVCLLTPWIDERLILGLPLAFLVRAMIRQQSEQGMRRDLIRDGIFIICFIAPYLLFRVIAARSDAVSARYIREAMDHATNNRTSIARRVDGIWTGMRLGWFYLAALVWISLPKAQRWESVLLLGTVLVTFASAGFVADDLSRNTMMFVPAILLGILLTIRDYPTTARGLLAACVTLNLLMPAAIVVTLFRQPVETLYSEIMEYQNPPAVVNAAAYNETAVELMSQGKTEEAKYNFDLAFRLDPDLPLAKLMHARVPPGTQPE